MPCEPSVTERASAQSREGKVNKAFKDLIRQNPWAKKEMLNHPLCKKTRKEVFALSQFMINLINIISCSYWVCNTEILWLEHKKKRKKTYTLYFTGHLINLDGVFKIKPNQQ